jgi:hypothetical protein
MCNTSLFVSHQYNLLVYHLGAQNPAHYFQICKGTEVQIDDSQAGAYLPLKHIHVQSADQVIFFSCMLCFPRLGRRTLQLSCLKRSGHAKQAQCSCKISSSANDEIGLLSRASLARTCGEVPSVVRAEAMAWRCHQKCHKDKTAEDTTSRL